MTFTDAQTLGVGAELVELTDVDFPEHGIALLVYLDESGKRVYGWRVLGDAAIDQTLGLLAIAQHQLINMAEDEDE